MKIQPLADRIIIEALEAEEKTAGGIVLPETAKNAFLEEAQRLGKHHLGSEQELPWRTKQSF